MGGAVVVAAVVVASASSASVGTYGVILMTGTVGERLAVYRIPWHTIDAILPM